MLGKKIAEFTVGIFMLAGVLAIFLLAFKVSGLGQYSLHDAFKVQAVFDNIGDLKVRAPVTIAGVRVGEVAAIKVDIKTFKAMVILLLDKQQTNLPTDTVAKILTAGIIGANYIELIPGYAATSLKDGDTINDTQPAIILENLISQLVYSLNGGKNKSESTH